MADQDTQQTTTQQPDLATRVSQVKIEPPKFNINDLNTEIEKVQDPKVKEQLLGLKKSLISGENQKYQEIAQLRKDLEAQNKLPKDPSNWTSEKVQDLLKDSTFVKAAQDVMETQESSMLSETEKTKINKLNSDIEDLRKQSVQASRLQQDEVLKNKYANYNTEAVDIITADLLQGKVQATREHLHKVLDYDSAIKRAYQLGKEDKNLETGEKMESTSIEGVTATRTEAPLKQEERENDRAYFKRLGEHNLAKSRQKK